MLFPGNLADSLKTSFLFEPVTQLALLFVKSTSGAKGCHKLKFLFLSKEYLLWLFGIERFIPPQAVN